MPLDEKTERLVKHYLGLKRTEKNFIIDPTTKNIDTRKRIKDPNGRPMFKQSPGLVDLQLQDTMSYAVERLSDEIDKTKYKKLRNESLDKVSKEKRDSVRDDAYVGVLDIGIAPEEPSKELEGIIGLLNVAETIETLSLQDKIMDAYNILKKIQPEDSENDDRKTTIIGQYEVEGEYSNARTMVKRYADMFKRVAKKKIGKSGDIRKEIDKAIIEKEAYGPAFTQIYKAYSNYERALEREKEKEKSKEK